MKEEIRRIILSAANLNVSPDEIEVKSDLFALGLSSLATVDVMLAIENAFDVEFSDEHLCRKTFRNIESLVSVVEHLKRQQNLP